MNWDFSTHDVGVVLVHAYRATNIKDPHTWKHRGTYLAKDQHDLDMIACNLAQRVRRELLREREPPPVTEEIREAMLWVPPALELYQRAVDRWHQAQRLLRQLDDAMPLDVPRAIATCVRWVPHWIQGAGDTPWWWNGEVDR